MRKFEKRVRALEGQQTGLRPMPCITVDVGETVEEVLEREGVTPIEGQWPGLIVNQIVAPRTNPWSRE